MPRPILGIIASLLGAALTAPTQPQDFTTEDGSSAVSAKGTPPALNFEIDPPFPSQNPEHVLVRLSTAELALVEGKLAYVLDEQAEEDGGFEESSGRALHDTEADADMEADGVPIVIRIRRLDKEVQLLFFPGDLRRLEEEIAATGTASITFDFGEGRELNLHYDAEAFGNLKRLIEKYVRERPKDEEQGMPLEIDGVLFWLSASRILKLEWEARNYGHAVTLPPQSPRLSTENQDAWGERALGWDTAKMEEIKDRYHEAFVAKGANYTAEEQDGLPVSYPSGLSPDERYEARLSAALLLDLEWHARRVGGGYANLTIPHRNGQESRSLVRVLSVAEIQELKERYFHYRNAGMGLPRKVSRRAVASGGLTEIKNDAPAKWQYMSEGTTTGLFGHQKVDWGPDRDYVGAAVNFTIISRYAPSRRRISTTHEFVLDTLAWYLIQFNLLVNDGQSAEMGIEMKTPDHRHLLIYCNLEQLLQFELAVDGLVRIAPVGQLRRLARNICFWLARDMSDRRTRHDPIVPHLQSLLDAIVEMTAEQLEYLTRFFLSPDLTWNLIRETLIAPDLVGRVLRQQIRIFPDGEQQLGNEVPRRVPTPKRIDYERAKSLERVEVRARLDPAEDPKSLLRNWRESHGIKNERGFRPVPNRPNSTTLMGQQNSTKATSENVPINAGPPPAQGVIGPRDRALLATREVVSWPRGMMGGLNVTRQLVEKPPTKAEKGASKPPTNGSPDPGPTAEGFGGDGGHIERRDGVSSSLPLGLPELPKGKPREPHLLRGGKDKIEELYD